jgi:hypothetical protein
MCLLDYPRMSNARSAGTDPPSLSLVLATLAGWPHIASVFNTQRAAVEAVGGELIVVDGSDHPAPRPEEIGPNTTWISAPGDGVFQLRAHAYPIARGAIIAQSEDHCAMETDWGQVLLDLHAEHPEAAVIGGVVENGSPKRMDDWATFFIGHFRDMPGVGLARRVPLVGLTNVSYKRNVVDAFLPAGDDGINEAAQQRMLAANGEVLLIDDRLRVSHIQSQGVSGMIQINWHSARTQAGMRRAQRTPSALVRLIAAPVSPLVYMALIANAVVRQRYQTRAFVKSAPMVFGLLAWRAVAELVGYAAGPGDSARRFP